MLPLWVSYQHARAHTHAHLAVEGKNGIITLAVDNDIPHAARHHRLRIDQNRGDVPQH
jgi:hypothetical protein